MTSVPMQLENHFFTKVVVEANLAYQPEKDEDQSWGIHTEVQIGQHKDDPRRWRVILNLRTEQSADKQIPYKIDLECVGLFKVGPEIEEKKMPFLVRANGAAILYSSAREFLLLITGRGPWEGLYLPTTNFLEPPKPKEEEPVLSGPAPKAPEKEKREPQPPKAAPEGMRKIRFKSKAKKTLDQLEGEQSES